MNKQFNIQNQEILEAQDMNGEKCEQCDGTGRFNYRERPDLGRPTLEACHFCDGTGRQPAPTPEAAVVCAGCGGTDYLALWEAANAELAKVREKLDAAQKAAEQIRIEAGDHIRRADEAERERDEAEQRLEDARLKLPTTHLTPENCPTWYDSCHCNVETLRHNIERAEKAEEELERLKAK